MPGPHPCGLRRGLSGIRPPPSIATALRSRAWSSGSNAGQWGRTGSGGSLHRPFGTLRSEGDTPAAHGDSGHIFKSCTPPAALRGCRLRQESITRYTLEQHCMIEAC